MKNMVSYASRPLYPQRSSAQYTLDKSLRGRLHRYGRENICPLPGTGTLFSCRRARRSVVG
jgi:hypothetical protein